MHQVTTSIFSYKIFHLSKIRQSEFVSRKVVSWKVKRCHRGNEEADTSAWIFEDVNDRESPRCRVEISNVNIHVEASRNSERHT